MPQSSLREESLSPPTEGLSWKEIVGFLSAAMARVEVPPSMVARLIYLCALRARVLPRPIDEYANNGAPARVRETPITQLVIKSTPGLIS